MPVEYQHLVDRWEEQEKLAFLRAGAIASAVYNSVRDQKKHPQAIVPADIFPLLSDRQKGEMSPAQEAAALDLFFSGIKHDAQKRKQNGQLSHG